MNWHSDILSGLIIGGIYLLIFAAAELWRYFGSPEVEKTRKFVHLSGGLVTLSFSYIFKTHWTILALSIVFFAIIKVTKKYGWLKSVHGVERESSGGLYFPIAIYATFLFNSINGTPHFYLISILVLSISDSLAALIGTSYGFKLYNVEEGKRSLEGSIMFFFSTFIITHTGLLLLTDIGRPESVLAGVYVALLVTGFEAISLGGTDNIFIPIGASYILIKITTKTARTIATEILILFAILLVFYLIAKARKKLGASGLIGTVLLAYGAWTLLKAHWFIPIFTGFVLFNFIDLFVERPKRNDLFQIRSVFYIAIVSFIWILAANYFYGTIDYIFMMPYLLNITANMSVLWGNKAKQDAVKGWIKHTGVILRAIILTAVFVPVQLYFDARLQMVYPLVTSILGIIAGDLIYNYIASRYFTDSPLLIRQRTGFCVNLTVSAMVLVANLFYYNVF